MGAPPSTPDSPRERILACVLTRPGVHLREVSREVGVPVATTLYHLDRLESQGLVRSWREHRTRRFFPPLPGPPPGPGALLRRVMARRLVLAVAAREGATQADLCEAMGTSRGNVSSQLSNLVRQGALVESHAGRLKSYAVSSPEVVLVALRGGAP